MDSYPPTVPLSSGKQMTPAINQAKKKKVPHTIHQYKHNPDNTAYGSEAAELLNIPPQRVFKTLVVELDTGQLAVAVIPVSAMLNLKQMAKAAGAKKSAMADTKLVQKRTGYLLGGVSPLGQKKAHPTFLDNSAKNFSTIFVSGGRRGLEIELAPEDLASLTGATFCDLTS